MYVHGSFYQPGKCSGACSLQRARRGRISSASCLEEHRFFDLFFSSVRVYRKHYTKCVVFYTLLGGRTVVYRGYGV